MMYLLGKTVMHTENRSNTDSAVKCLREHVVWGLRFDNGTRLVIGLGASAITIASFERGLKGQSLLVLRH